MKKKFIKPALLILFIILAIVIGRYTDLGRFLDRAYLEGAIASLGIYGPIVFMGLYFLATVFFLPGTPLSILSGILFGSIYGTIYVVLGATFGATAAFFVSRLLGKDFVGGILKDKFKTLDKYDQKLGESGLLTMLFLRLVPLFPFNGLNFAMGLTRISARDYIIGTLVGIIPGAFVLVNIGASSEDLTGPKFFLFIGLFLLLAAVPKIYKRFSRK